MEPKTLQQIGQDLLAAAGTLSWEQRKDVAAALMENLRKPVGSLKIRRTK